VQFVSAARSRRDLASRRRDRLGEPDRLVTRREAAELLGFTDAQQRAGFFHGREIESLSNTLARLTSAIHAYDVSAALTYVKDGTILPHYQQ
jgi:hypothetical protein